MPTRRRDQCRQTVDQFERRQEQADTAAGAGLEALVDQMFGVDLAQSFEREDRTGAVAEQALKAGSASSPPSAKARDLTQPYAGRSCAGCPTTMGASDKAGS